MAIKLVISGCCGRMGSRIAQLALADSLFTIRGAIEAVGHRAIGRDLGHVLGTKRLEVSITNDAKRAIRSGDVVIEFTVPEVTVEHAKLAAELRKPIVIGTTGLSESQRAAIARASARIPIVLSPNMSVGVNVLFDLARETVSRLGPAYDVEIIEAHHKAKKDAPSGTARRLGEVIARARRKSSGSIPIHAIRAGDIVGDHTVIFAGPFERLELTHRAHSREVFAQGALRAAAFVVKRRPGLYDMTDVLKD